MKVLFLAALSAMSLSAFSAEYTGALIAVCTDSRGSLKTFTADSIETANGAIQLLKYNRRTGMYQKSKAITANCTIEAERGGISTQ